MKILVAVVMAVVAGSALAQNHRHKRAPYAGMQTRIVKALTEQQVGDLRAEHGMGLALAAELNGYPGLLHVIKLADRQPWC
jgi:hypothetical protein